MNEKQKEIIKYIKGVINKSGGALPSDARLEQYAREITSIVIRN